MFAFWYFFNVDFGAVKGIETQPVGLLLFNHPERWADGTAQSYQQKGCTVVSAPEALQFFTSRFM